MPAVRVVLAAFLVAALMAPAAAQAPTFNKYGSTPQSWRPSELAEPGVNARGDLGLDIPVLSVPGRGGLGYDVRFQYASGIRVDQPSSWVGGGWYFDPGSITRDVFGIVTGGQAYNVDYALSNPTVQPDQYQVTLPGASSAMVRPSPTGTGGIFNAPRALQSQFVLTAYRAWRVQFTTASPVTVDGVSTTANGSTRADFNSFTITTEDGTRYVFQNPTIGTYVGSTASFNYSLENYVAMWRLVAILGTDYVATNVVPTGTESGSWVWLKYTAPTTATTSGPECEGGEPPPLQRAQASHLREIVTPTHKAVFTLGGSSGGVSPVWRQSLNASLSKIELYYHGGNPAGAGTLLRTATLTQTARFASPDGCGYTARLALDQIAFTGRNAAAEPGYAFEYVAEVGGTIFPANRRDHFGFYDHTGSYTGDYNLDADDGAAWSLKKITYPTGGSDVITYVNDELASNEATTAVPVSFGTYTASSASSGSAGTGTYSRATNQSRQGGARVYTIARSDGMPTATTGTTTYTYGPGRLTGVPPGYWRQQYASRPFFSPVERGQIAVSYETIERVGPDGSRVKTYYTTPTSHAGVVKRLQTVAWLSGGTAAMTLVQGNQDWNWGRPYETEFLDPTGTMLRREVLTTHELVGANAFLAWQISSPNVYIEWGYADRVTKEVVKDYAASGSATAQTVTDYLYMDAGSTAYPGNHLVRQVDVTHEDGRKRRTSYTYAFAQYAGLTTGTNTTLGDQNRLSELARTDVAEVSTSGTTRYFASTVTTYKSFTAMAVDEPVTLYKPNQTFGWAAAASSTTLPSFPTASWSTTATVTAPPTGWEVDESYTEYDGNGPAKAIADARGYVTRLTYNSLGYLTAVVAPTANGVTLSRAYAYDPVFAPALRSVTDENARVETYGYDDLGRLNSVTGRVGAQTLSVAYATTAVPFKVTTTLYTGGTPATNVSATFYDGLGRVVQTQDKASDAAGNNDWVVSAMEYRPGAGSVGYERAYRPYTAATAGAYAAGYAAAAVTAYGTGSKPYTTTEFTRDGTGQPDRVVHPYTGVTVPVTDYDYSVGPVDGTGPSYRYVDVVDEDARRTRTFTDAWGLGFRLQEAVGTTLEAKTHTVFDVLGRPLEVRQPNYTVNTAYKVTSVYDTQGQLTSQATPDAGTTQFKYDRAGNLRYSQDANQLTAGTVGFTTYDELGRPLSTGVAAATWSSLVGTGTVQTFETTAANVRVARAYDQKPSTAAGTPFNPYATPVAGAVLTNMKGHLVAMATLGEGATPGRQAELSSYDNAGRLAGRFSTTLRRGTTTEATPFATALTYQYDHQDRLTRRTSLVGTGATARRFEHWYDYDARGLNTFVYAATTATKPAADVAYTYTAAGAVGSVRYRTQTSVPYAYDVRGRLTDIGGTSWASTNATNRPFIAHYNYSPGGDVLAAQFGHNPGGASGSTAAYFQYVTTYDARHRLSTADYFTAGTVTAGSAIAFGAPATGAYDLPLLLYDANGNLTRLKRHDQNGTLIDDLTYTYTPGKNRLAALADAGSGYAEWDAETGSFAYDANGNATALPAPFQATVTHDWRNQPIKISYSGAGRVAALRYGADGQAYLRESDLAGGELGLTTAPMGAPTPTPSGTVAGQTAVAQPRPGEAADRPAPPSSAGTVAVDSAAGLPQAPPPQEAPTPERAPRTGRSASPWAQGRVARPGAEPAPVAPPPAGPPAGPPAPGASPAAPPAAGPVPETPAQAAPPVPYVGEFLALDGHEAAGLRPVVGTIALSTGQEAGSATLDIAFNVLTPSGEVAGQALPGGTSRRYYHKDLLGSTRAVVTETGALAEHRAYDPWGVVIGAGASGSEWLETDEGFTGKPRMPILPYLGDPAAGLDDFGARTYAAAYGRFLQTDPLWAKHPGWTPYHYVLDNPLALVDPDGRQVRAGVRGPGFTNLGIGAYRALSGFRAIVGAPGARRELAYQATVTVGPLAVLGIVEAAPAMAAWALGNPVAATVAANETMDFIAGATTGMPDPQGFGGGTLGQTLRTTATSSLRVGRFELTRTVANHIDDVLTRGPFGGQAARPFLTSSQLIEEIMSAGRGFADPRGVAGALRWEVPGRFRGSEGVWELVAEGDRILHFNLVSN